MSTNTQLSVTERTVALLQETAPLLSASVKMASDQRTLRDKIAAKIPQVVDALVSRRLIQDSDRVKAASVLSDPVKALDVLMQTVDRLPTAESVEVIGTPVGEKRASAQSSGGLRDADRKLFEAFGINPEAT